MDLNGFLNQIKGITNTTIDSNCFDGQYNVLEGLQQIQSKINEVIDSINQGVIKGDKGDKGDNGQTPVINVGTTTQLNPEDKAIVSQTGTPLNMTLNFGIPKGEKGEKGDPGNARIDDTIQSPLTTWSSDRIFNEINSVSDVLSKESFEDNFKSIDNTKNGYLDNILLEGKTLIVDSDNNVVLPGTQGAMLKSVGDENDNIIIKSLNANMFDGTVKNQIVNTDGQISSSTNGRSTDYIKIPSNTILTVSIKKYNQDRNALIEYDKNKNFVRFINATQLSVNGEYTFNTSVNAKYLIYYYNSSSQISNSEIPNYIMVNYGINKINYIKQKMNVKKVLYKDTDGTWEKPTLRQWDSIEKHSDGKYYYHKRSYERIFNGGQSENWLLSTENTNTLLVYLDDVNCKQFGKVISDKFNYYLPDQLGSQGNEGISISFSANRFIIRISKSKLSTPNIAGFKIWLQSNNINIVSEANIENTFECTPIDLISYDTQTNYSIECGPIYPKTTLSLMFKLGDLIYSMKQQISILQNNQIESLKTILSSGMKGLAMYLYPNDFINESEELKNDR